MKKFFILLLFLVFGGLTVFVGWKLLPQAVNFSGLQVIANGTEADIYLNNKKIGTTPFESEKQHPGEYELRLVPLKPKMKTWSKKINLITGVMTTVERYFSEDVEKNGGLILSLSSIDSKTAQIEVITNPDEATVYYNKENKGKTPVTIDEVPTGNQEIIIKKDGYEDRIHKIDAISGYKISLVVDLVVEKTTITKPENTLGASASGSGKISGKPTAILTSSVTPAISKKPSGQIEVIETGTGWLRVRVEPSTSASESARVNVGQKFSVLDEQNGWIKIQYKPGVTGWISSDYVKKL